MTQRGDGQATVEHQTLNNTIGNGFFKKNQYHFLKSGEELLLKRG